MSTNAFLPWRESHKIRTFEVDFSNTVKFSSIYNYLQEAASNDSERLKFGYDELIEKGFFWVLSRAKLYMFAYPHLGDEIVVETWHKGNDKLFGIRDFKIYDASEKIIGKATTAWLLIEVKTMKPTKLDILSGLLPKHNIEPALTEILGKIFEPKIATPASERLFDYTDIDVNKHVNNVKYIECVLDAFPIELYTRKQISSLQINFLSESKYGDRINVFSSELTDEESYCVIGVRNDGTKVFQAIVEWKNKEIA